MALYNLAFYRIYHLIFGQKRYFFIQLQKRQNVRDRISSYAYLLAMELDYLTTTTCEWQNHQPRLNKQICLPSMHLCNIKRYEQKYAMNFNKLLG